MPEVLMTETDTFWRSTSPPISVVIQEPLPERALLQETPAEQRTRSALIRFTGGQRVIRDYVLLPEPFQLNLLS